MRSLLLLLALSLVPLAAHAGQTLCFRLQDGGQPQLGYLDVKLLIQPNCAAAVSPQAGKVPTISAVHGTTQGFDDMGNPTEGFLLAGTCEGNVGQVVLDTNFIGGGGTLSIFGSSLQTGTASSGLLSAPVVPAACQDLDL